MKISSLICLVIFGSQALFSSVLVLPLDGDQQNHASYQWLGKAVAYYLTIGLNLNSLPALAEEEAAAILAREHIPFPFAMSKATAISLAVRNGVRYLVWGKVMRSEGKVPLVSLKLFVVDTQALQQTYLPLIRGNARDLEKIQSELLKELLEVLTKDVSQIRYPRLVFAPVDYERFIKSLLVNEPEKKLTLLLPDPEAAPGADFFRFELAKTYLGLRDWPKAGECLQRIASEFVYREKVEFMKSLLAYFTGNLEQADAGFAQLQASGTFPVDVFNNRALIRLQRGELSSAENLLAQALALHRDADLYANYVYVLLREGNQASRPILIQALRATPDDRGLLRLFAYLLDGDENGEALFQVFQNYVSLQPVAAENGPDFIPVLRNPLRGVTLAEAVEVGKNDGEESGTGWEESDPDVAQEKIEEDLQRNPFQAENYCRFSQFLIDKKQFRRAETYALAGLFLEESAAGYLLLAQIYRAIGNSAKSREIIRQAREKFPADRDLQKFRDA